MLLESRAAPYRVVTEIKPSSVFNAEPIFSGAACVWRIADSGEISNSPHTAA